MLIDRPQIVEGSSIQNATVPSGTVAPSAPNAGELFYFTSSSVTGTTGLHVYNGGAWAAVSTGNELTSHVTDDAKHLTASQNAFIDALATTLTAAELNFVDGVTAPIQPQLDSKLAKYGGTMTGGIDMGANRVSNLGTPVQTADATTKQYVDSEISRSVPAGTAGQVPFIVTDGTRTSKQDFIVQIGQFIETDAELAAAKARSTTGSIYDTRNGAAYKYVSSAWVVDNSTSLVQAIGAGRLVYDRYTTKMYFVDSNLGTIKLTSNAGEGAASDVSALNAQVNGHINDASIHITAAQDTLLNSLTATAAEINRLAGVDSYLTSVSSASVASKLADLDNTKLAKTGGTLTGDLIMSGGKKITGLPTPTLASDAVNKDYVDIFVQGIHWPTPVKAATTSAIALTGLQTIDGVALAVNDRVLVKDQSTPSENGIYLVSSGAWSRAADYNAVNEINQSAVLVLAGGVANGKGSFIQTSTISTLGDAINFTPFSGPVVNSAGNGISLAAGGTVSVKEAAGLTFDAGGNLIIDLASNGGLMTTVDNSTSSTAPSAQLALANVGTAGTYRSVTTDAKGRVVAGSNPTTLAGFGITDAVKITGDTMTGNLQWQNGTIILNGSPATGAALFSTAPYGTSQGDNKTHFGYKDNAGNFVNYLRGVSTTVEGNFSVGGTASVNGVVSIGAKTFISIANSTEAGLRVTMPGSAQYAIELTRSDTSFTSSVYNDGAGWRFQHNPSINGSANVHAGNIGTYAPTLTGTGASGTWGISISGNAATASSVAFSSITGLPNRTNWNSTTTPFSVVVGQLGWRSFGNNHTIFDASNELAPDGTTVINRTNAAVAWSASYPTLMGWNGSQTYGVRVDSARVSDTTSQTTFGRVKTDGVTRGTYGSISISGSGNSHSGIDFTDASATFAVNTTDQSSGLIKSNTTWLWSFDGAGALSNGTVPGARVTGAVSSASAAALAAKASSVALGGGNGSAMTFTYTNSAGTPVGVWGTADGVTSTVFNPANFSVLYATTAGNVSSISSAVGSAYVWTANQQFRSNADTGAVGVTVGAPLQAFSNNNSGAIMTFNRSGQYAVNMGLDSDNVFRIGGSSAAASRLQMDMSGNLTMSGDVAAFSDIRKKKDIKVIDNALAKVESIRGVNFTRVEDGVRGSGVIAQEVQAVLPEVVKADSEGILSVAYGNMVGLLVEAVKDLSAEVKSLKAEIEALKSR